MTKMDLADPEDDGLFSFEFGWVSKIDVFAFCLFFCLREICQPHDSPDSMYMTYYM